MRLDSKKFFFIFFIMKVVCIQHNVFFIRSSIKCSKSVEISTAYVEWRICRSKICAIEALSGSVDTCSNLPLACTTSRLFECKCSRCLRQTRDDTIWRISNQKKQLLGRRHCRRCLVLFLKAGSCSWFFAPCDSSTCASYQRTRVRHCICASMSPVWSSLYTRLVFGCAIHVRKREFSAVGHRT